VVVSQTPADNKDKGACKRLSSSEAASCESSPTQKAKVKKAYNELIALFKENMIEYNSIDLASLICSHEITVTNGRMEQRRIAQGSTKPVGVRLSLTSKLPGATVFFCPRGIWCTNSTLRHDWAPQSERRKSP